MNYCKSFLFLYNSEDSASGLLSDEESEDSAFDIEISDMTEYKKVFCPRHELRKDLVISYISPSSVLRSEFMFISFMLNLEVAAVLSGKY